MPASWIEPGRFPVGGVPAVKWMQTVAAPTFIRGAAVVSTAGLIDECGADPLLIKGFALAGADTAPGFQAANSPATFTGREENVSVALANSVTEFMGRLTNNSNVTVAPVAADNDAEYGLTKQANGEWTVDQSKVGASARVKISGIDTINNRVLFKVLPAYQQ